MNRSMLHESIIQNVRLVFSRSGGNGGQNVNKVNSKVQVFILPEKLSGLSETELELARKKLSANINSQGEIFAVSQEERTQERNRAIALERLENRIASAVRQNPVRHRTKPTKASQEKRLASKKLHSLLKSQRSLKSFF